MITHSIVVSNCKRLNAHRRRTKFAFFKVEWRMLWTVLYGSAWVYVCVCVRSNSTSLFVSYRIYLPFWKYFGMKGACSHAFPIQCLRKQWRESSRMCSEPTDDDNGKSRPFTLHELIQLCIYVSATCVHVSVCGSEHCVQCTPSVRAYDMHN